MKKTIVITGAAGVLCSAFARALAADGHCVALLDLNEQAVQQLAADICAQGGNAIGCGCSVLEIETLQQAKQMLHTAFGPCDVLINGAGGNSPRCTTAHETYEPGDEAVRSFTTFFNIERTGFDFVFGLNLDGTLLPCQVFMQDMLGRTGCCVLNISSMNAFTPLTKIPAYSAAKAAVSNFTKWLAVHFAPQKIRVNAIAPGFFVTAQNRSLLFEEDGTPTARSEKILRATPAGRFGEPEELLGAVRFLIDEEAAGFVSGVVLPVDGGFSAYSGV